jgi:putative ABC transport system ATP-binding protein
MSVLVEATELEISYAGSAVLTSVDLTVSAGDEIALTGRSGSGKTTLLLALAGLLPTSGAVRWPGLSADPLERRRQIGLVFQAPSLVPELTATENVMLPLRLHGATRQSATAAAGAALADVGLGEVGPALPAELSGGQRQRVALARALAGDPLVLVADEPTGSVDRETGARMVAVLRSRMRLSGGALVIATHDEDVAELLPTRVELRDGRLRPGAPPAATTPSPASPRGTDGDR